MRMVKSAVSPSRERNSCGFESAKSALSGCDTNDPGAIDDDDDDDDENEDELRSAKPAARERELICEVGEKFRNTAGACHYEFMRRV